MQIRCQFCQNMFATTREADLSALRARMEEGLHHFDAHCPRCRKVNHIGMDRIERLYPNWRQEINAAPRIARPEPVKQAVVKPAPKPVEKKPVAKASAKTVEKKPAAKTATKKPAAKATAKTAAKSPAVKKTTAKPAAKSTTKKPAAKKTTAKGTKKSK